MTTVTLTVPDKGWVYKPNEDSAIKVYNVATDNDVYSNSPIIDLSTKTLEKLNFYVDEYENLLDIQNRKIGGVDMKGRTYENVGMEWTEYYADLGNGVWMSVRISGIDLSPTSEGSKLLDSVSFETKK